MAERKFGQFIYLRMHPGRGCKIKPSMGCITRSCNFFFIGHLRSAGLLAHWPARLAKSKEEKCIVQLNFIIFATKLQRFSCAKVCAWSDKETGFWRIFSHNNFLFSQLIFKKKELHHISGFFCNSVLPASCLFPPSSCLHWMQEQTLLNLIFSTVWPKYAMKPHLFTIWPT